MCPPVQLLYTNKKIFKTYSAGQWCSGDVYSDIWLWVHFSCKLLHKIFELIWAVNWLNPLNSLEKYMPLKFSICFLCLVSCHVCADTSNLRLSSPCRAEKLLCKWSTAQHTGLFLVKAILSFWVPQDRNMLTKQKGSQAIRCKVMAKYFIYFISVIAVV
jgi:hypothetical protein